MKYVFAYVLLIINLTLNAYQSDNSFCENLDRADKEAETAWNTSTTPKIALHIMNDCCKLNFFLGSSGIDHCFVPDKQVAILERYAKYAELSNDYYFKDWAIGAYKRILVLQPSSAKAHFELSRLYMAKGQLDRDLSITELAREHMREYIKLVKSSDMTDENKIRVDQLKEELGLKTTTKTFGTNLDKNSQKIPINAYRVYYFNTAQPDRALDSKVMERIAVNLTPNDMKMDDKSFGAYWVGYKDFSKDQIMTIRPQETWGKSKIYIDGYQVLTSEGNIARPLDYLFKKGRHKIEVEFINNWHTAGFSVNIAPKKELLSKDGLKEKLKTLLTSKSELYFYSVHESKREDQVIDIFLTENRQPVVLVLLSHYPVRWTIHNQKKQNIEAIIYVSVEGSSEAVGDIPDESRIFHISTQAWVENYVDRYRAKCDHMYLDPEAKDLAQTIGRFQSVMNNKKIVSLNQTGATHIFEKPIMLTNEQITDIENKYRNFETSKIECMAAEKRALESKFIKPSNKTYNEGYGDIKKGQKAYLKNCKSCHGPGIKGASMATQDQWDSAFVEHGKQIKEIHQKTDGNPYFQSPLFEEHYRDLREFLYEYASDVGRGE